MYPSNLWSVEYYYHQIDSKFAQAGKQAVGTNLGLLRNADDWQATNINNNNNQYHPLMSLNWTNEWARRERTSSSSS